MITTIFSGNSRIEKSILAVSLAAWCMHRQREVLILDCATHKHVFLWSLRRGSGHMPLHIPVDAVLDASLYTELDQLHPRSQDIMIDVDDVTDPDTRTALVAANTVIVPLCTRPRDEQAEASVVALLERTQLFNPLLRVVLVVVEAGSTETPGPLASAHAMADRIRSATVAPVIIHDSADLRAVFQKGQTLFEAATASHQAVAEMEGLARAVFGNTEVASGMMPELQEGLAKLRSWQQSLRPNSRHHRRAG